MSRIQSGEQDPFGKMLVWSGFLHLVLFGLIATASQLGAQRSVLPVPSVAWVVSGPSGAGLGGDAAPTATPPKPPPEEPKEPAPKEPRVVRPTKEERDQLPRPDAKPARVKPEPPKPSSGLTGRDAASAPSARLKNDEPAGLGGLGLGAAGGSPFDAPFEYDYYVYQMLGKIRRNWTPQPVTRAVMVQIGFTILRDGHLEGVSVEQSSGVDMLDRGAERAVLLADPLPPLPTEFPRDRVGVHLRFQYSNRY